MRSHMQGFMIVTILVHSLQHDLFMAIDYVYKLAKRLDFSRTGLSTCMISSICAAPIYALAQ